MQKVAQLFFSVYITCKVAGTRCSFLLKISQPTLKAATHLLFIDRKYLFTRAFTFNDKKNIIQETLKMNSNCKKTPHAS